MTTLTSWDEDALEMPVKDDLVKVSLGFGFRFWFRVLCLYRACVPGSQQLSDQILKCRLRCGSVTPLL